MKRAAQALFGLRSRAPYYVVAPAYDESSAGIRALYVLVHALNCAGEEAYAVLASRGGDVSPWRPEMEGLRAPWLTREMVEAHHRTGRRPVTVYPEVFLPPEYAIATHDGVTVQYALNYLGHLAPPPPVGLFEMTYAYAANIAARTPGCSGVLHIPAVDPDYWTPREGIVREGAWVYTGKYVEVHGQTLPPELAHVRQITRFRPDSVGRQALREVLRTADRLYVFENTALATEAALCGCPVVYRLNAFFDELISAQETGMNGFVSDDDEESLRRARETVSSFRQDYMQTLDRFGASLEAFVQHTQACAVEKPYTRAFRL